MFLERGSGEPFRMKTIIARSLGAALSIAVMTGASAQESLQSYVVVLRSVPIPPPYGCTCPGIASLSTKVQMLPLDADRERRAQRLHHRKSLGATEDRI